MSERRIDKLNFQENNTTQDHPLKWSDAVCDFIMSGFPKVMANEFVETLTGNGARQFGQSFGQDALVRLVALDPAGADAYADLYADA